MQPLLNPLKRLRADKPFMLSFPARHAPIRRFDVSGIKTLVENLIHPLMRNGAGLAPWKERIVLQEAHDFGLRAEMA